MAAGRTYTPIARTTLSTVGTCTFSSIPQTYTDLVIVVTINSDLSLSAPALRFNGDTGNNYSYTSLVGTGSSASSGRTTNDDVLRMGDVFNNSMIRIFIMNYANTTTFKTAMSRSDAAQSRVSATVGTWRNTNAISTVAVTNFNYPIGTTFTLYGIAAA